jgi:type IV secretion system protein VirB11
MQATFTKPIDSLTNKLKPFLSLEGASDFAINKEGEIWIERSGLWTVEPTDFMLNHMQVFADVVANYSRQTFDESNPMLSATLPDGYRIQFVLPPASKIITETGSENTIGISIRKQTASPSVSLEMLENQGYFSKINEAEQHRNLKKQQLKKLADAKDWPAFFKSVVQNRQTVLVSGGTGAGKTFFLNILLNLMPPNHRVITIEDNTPELLPKKQPNHLRLFYSRAGDFSASQLLSASLRMKPTVIMVGELREPTDACLFLEAANSGHEGSASTIHADSCDMALNKLKNLAASKWLNQSSESIISYIRSIINVVVQIKRHPSDNRPYVSEVLVV